MGGRGGSQTPEDSGGIGCLLIPALEGIQRGGGWEEGQLFLTPYSMEYKTWRGCFPLGKLLESPLPPPMLILGWFPCVQGGVFRI